MICKELSQTFKSQRELFTALKANKAEIIRLKKAAIKCSDPIGLSIVEAVSKTGQTVKGEPGQTLEYGDHIYPVINTTLYLDSHNDLHLNGIWDKSAMEQNGKTYYIINHDLAIGKVISYPQDVEIMVKDMAWTELGQNIAGRTQALIFKAKLTENSNQDAYKAIKSGAPIQNSIRMVYVDLDLAVNSKDPDFMPEKKIWDTHYPAIANKDQADNVGYFWAVSEAKIYKEGSAVLFGSNDATPVLTAEPKNIGPSQDTQDRAADRTRVKAELKNLLLKTKKITG